MGVRSISSSYPASGSRCGRAVADEIPEWPALPGRRSPRCRGRISCQRGKRDTLAREDEEECTNHFRGDHAERYVEGNIHTNGIENFWTLLKRCIKGTYVSVEPFHLFRYLDEQSFRYNERKNDDGDRGRFIEVLRQIVGRRVTYKELIGNNAVAS